MERKHKAKQNDRALYKTSDTSYKYFIIEVIDKTWYKELEDSYTFYTNVMNLKILDHLTEFFWGLYTVDAVEIPQPMKTFFDNIDRTSQFINVMEAAQRKSKREELEIQDKCMHAVVLNSLLKSGEYETKTREWSKLPDDQQTWTAWKTTCREAYVTNRGSEATREGEDKPFDGSALNKAHNKLC